MKIITVSREFGSGGREIGKRLADELGFDYYDREIIEAVAKNKGVDADYAEKALENHLWKTYSVSFGRSFATLSVNAASLLAEEKKVIEKIAGLGKDFVIVGRNADVILKDCEPFNIFVCADMQSKIRRCKERAAEDEKLSEKEIEQKIRRIDKARRESRQLISGTKWGDKSYYHLVVNTTQWNIKELTPAVADFANKFFGRTK